MCQSASDNETKLMDIPQLGLALRRGWAWENWISQDVTPKIFATHITGENHIQYDIYWVDDTRFHSVGMNKLSRIKKKAPKGTTYIIAIIVLYWEDSRGPKMERAFRAIHQMRPARNSINESLERQMAWEKRTHENSNEQI